MADDGSAQSSAVWPLPKFYFSVDLGDGNPVSFQEVSGLESETQIIEYRHGNSSQFSPIKMPGIAKVGNVTMKKGIFKKDARLWAWFAEIKMNTIKRRTVIISLLDEAGAPTMIWTLNNAWPTKISGTDLKSDGDEVAVGTIELAYETLSITNR